MSRLESAGGGGAGGGSDFGVERSFSATKLSENDGFIDDSALVQFAGTGLALLAGMEVT